LNTSFSRTVFHQIQLGLILSILLTIVFALACNKPSITAMPTIITAEISPEVARDIALQFAAKTLGVSVESLKVYEQESQSMDILTKEKVEYLAIGNDRLGVADKLIVDSSGKVMDVYEYQKAVEDRYQKFVGNINKGLYSKLQTLESSDTVKVKVFTSSKSEIEGFIRSRGYSITNKGNLPDGMILIYVELPKRFILELGKKPDVDIEEDLPDIVP
jgi:hypothetical protein